MLVQQLRLRVRARSRKVVQLSIADRDVEVAFGADLSGYTPASSFVFVVLKSIALGILARYLRCLLDSGAKSRLSSKLTQMHGPGRGSQAGGRSTNARQYVATHLEIGKWHAAGLTPRSLLVLLGET